MLTKHIYERYWLCNGPRNNLEIREKVQNASRLIFIILLQKENETLLSSVIWGEYYISLSLLDNMLLRLNIAERKLERYFKAPNKLESYLKLNSLKY